MSLPRPALLPLDREGFLARVQLTGVAAGYFLAGAPAVALFVLTVVSLALIPVVVGGLMLLVLVPVLASYAGAHRRWTGRLLGRDLGVDYPDSPKDPIRRLLRWAQTETRWRDVALTAYAITGGWVIGLIVLCAAVAPFSLAVQPLLHGPALLKLLWIGVLPSAVLWWVLTPVLVPVNLEVEAAILGDRRVEELEQEVERVSAARSESIDHSAAELRRIERDLHDGAQARMVSLGMNLGMIESLLRTDPDAAAALLDEARGTTLSALADLRSVVRGIHPPVLADRGLVGAVQALALDVSLPVLVRGELDGRAPAPVESAMYFAVAECLANVVKHAGARQVWVDLSHRDHTLLVLVRDDGYGGADPASGSGLAGISRRLGVFDGTLAADSPPGGPTTITLTIPCELVAS